jgi:lipopolysaccharide assembly outer membrane protein LptD (OstA)
VNDPQFTLTCSKLTVLMKNEAATKSDPKAKASPESSAKPNPSGSPATAEPGLQEGGGIDKAVAEGNVVIRQEKPSENGGPPQINIGKGRRVIFDNKTGEVTLRGWPQLQQGISTHIATSQQTVMVLDRAGHLQTTGPSITRIQDQPDPSPSAKPSSTPRASLLPLGGLP